MMLADGDMVQYHAIKKGTVGDYLNKLDNYVSEIEREVKANKQSQASARKR